MENYLYFNGSQSESIIVYISFSMIQLHSLLCCSEFLFLTEMLHFVTD